MQRGTAGHSAPPINQCDPCFPTETRRFTNSKTWVINQRGFQLNLNIPAHIHTCVTSLRWVAGQGKCSWSCNTRTSIHRETQAKWHPRRRREGQKNVGIACCVPCLSSSSFTTHVLYPPLRSNTMDFIQQVYTGNRLLSSDLIWCMHLPMSNVCVMMPTVSSTRRDYTNYCVQCRHVSI